jgi:hypothetical protein
MIRLTKDQANDVVVTLTEKGTASHYLFEFFSSATHVYHYCVDQDTSAHPERYNKFTITETSNPTPADGEVELEEGEYRYVIYANSSSSNVDPTGLTELESGMCTVTSASAAIPSYDIAETIAAYEG